MIMRLTAVIACAIAIFAVWAWIAGGALEPPPVIDRPASGMPDASSSAVEEGASGSPLHREAIPAQSTPSRLNEEGTGDAVFSGWVVDSLGNAGSEYEIEAYPLQEIIALDRSSERAGEAGLDGSFRIAVPAEWRGRAIGVVARSPDRATYGLIQTRAKEGVTLMVQSLNDPANRIKGSIRIRGTVSEGRWLMPFGRARGVIAADSFDGGAIELGTTPLHLKRPVWQEEEFGFAVFSGKLQPVAYRPFRSLSGFEAWVNEHPIIDVGDQEVVVPRIKGQAVSRLEFGFSGIGQAGVSWWGEAEVVEGRVTLSCEAGTDFVVIGHAANGKLRAIGRVVVELSSGVPRVRWATVSPGDHDLEVIVALGSVGRKMVLDVRAVPFAAPGLKVQSPSAWRTVKLIVKDGEESDLAGKISGLPAGDYEIQLVAGRNVLSTEQVRVPCGVVSLVLEEGASVAFDVKAATNGRLAQPIEVTYAPHETAGTTRSAILMPGLGGFRGLSIMGVQPGDYSFSLKVGSRYAEGRFSVHDHGKAVLVEVEDEPLELVEGVIMGIELESACRISVVGVHLKVPWLEGEVNKDGGFKVRVPLRYRDRGLELVCPGLAPRLVVEAADGIWRVS